jgi:thiamine-phosphate pyrophosphorylase
MIPMTPVLCMITALDRMGGSEDALVRRVEAASRAGVPLVQVREPALEGRALARLVRRCLAVVDRARTRVVVNERLDVALATGASGVHLREASMPAERVRALTPPAFLVGRSVHSPETAREVSRSGAVDYLIAGTVFRSASKSEGVATGVRALADVVAASTVPVLAVGGVNAANAGEVAGAGASGLAAIDLFAVPDDAELPEILARTRTAFAAGHR